jgi:ribosomal protein L37E
MTMTYCKNCGTQLDAHIKFCSGCGFQIAQISSQENASSAISRISEAKRKLKLPAIGIIISAGINLALFLFGLMWLGDVPEFRREPVILRSMQTLCILFLLVFAFSIYGAVQMMNTR